MGPHRKPSTTLLKRTNAIAEVRGDASQPAEIVPDLLDSESALSQIRHSERYPELATTRREAHGWRFYHDFDTSAASSLRRPQVSTFSPILDDDGRNLAAALQTIRETGGSDRLSRAMGDAFPGCELDVIDAGKARLELSMHVPGLKRPLEASELSDGTLRFLALTAALLTPRPPSLLAFNEPESSLHAELLPPLARLLVDASRECQVWVTTHSNRLTDLLQKLTRVQQIRLELQDGATTAITEEEDV